MEHLALVLSFCVAIFLFSFFYRFLIAPYRLLSSHGIKGPRPLPIVGNYHSIRMMGHEEFLRKQIDIFGPVFSYYVGAAPRVVVADPEVLKEIMVKQFDSFRDRGWMGIIRFAPKALGYLPGLLVHCGETWRVGRQTFTPSFSAMKMKLMVPLLQRSSDTLVEKMREYAKSGKSVEVFRVYGAFTLEALIATAFGRYVDIQRGEADQLTDAARTVFRASEEGSSLEPVLLLMLLSNLPCLELLLMHVLRKSAPGKALKLVHSIAVGLIKERTQCSQPPKVKDLLQLMIDATADADDSDGSTKKLTSEEIAGFSVDFLLAGYETTANTLSFTTYLLATHPDVQEKLQAEIDHYLEEDPQGSLYEAAQKMKYLDMVFQESMRLYTPVAKFTRYCPKTVTVGDVTFPKGVDVLIPVNQIHHLPQYWPDPYKFDPERFTPEAREGQPKMIHMPFGWGPRSCIGMRFSLLEAKIAFIEILREFSFARGPETVANLEQVYGITSTPKGGVFVNIVPRT